MNRHNTRYLAKILCLKAAVRSDPFAVVSRDTVRMYDIEVEYGDLVTVVTVTHKLETSRTVFQVFNETSVAYSPLPDDYGEPIVLTTYMQREHTKFPLSMLYIDVVASDMFPTFKRPTEEEAAVVAAMQRVGGRREPVLKLPRMLDTELVCKILHLPEHPLRVVRFLRRNMFTGVEVADRSVSVVLD
ncbi:RNA polymerase subunit RPO22 [Orf virus]|uniref:DNA-directed RNA polymerase subunit n=3 Tax=Orf virus TaxID=10258 RepID=W5U447_ORFV|nr:RNA polymerase subunit RPO22 [Orf virus]AHH34243.1 RNA polymerase subunit RPO22 [Orf virus]WIF30017.1 RNA polymerase subunit RPO22 [Orf virus]WIF30149.1 RNA polymerase subunit RPO22 [Orf virus]WIF30281.1 RNA polymerase subunit RPO22 [Orf virus]